MNTTYHIKAKTYKEYLSKLQAMIDSEDPALGCANIEWEEEKEPVKKPLKSYDVEITRTVSVEAENEDDAYEKAIWEFRQEGISMECFYVYINGEEY